MRTESPSDPPRLTVRLPTGPATYTDEGQGTTVLAVHGLPGSVRDFRWLAPALTSALRVVRVDLPGFGGTPVRTEPDPSPEGRARHAIAVADALELDRPVLLGHSMGGVVGAAAVALAPDRFRGLAMICSPGRTRNRSFRKALFTRVERALALPVAGRALLPVVQWFFERGGFRGVSEADVVRTMQCAAATSIEAHARRVDALELPTLVAWCEDDPIIESAISHDLAQACPPGPRLGYETGGHNPQKSQSKPLGEALRRWVATLD